MPLKKILPALFLVLWGAIFAVKIIGEVDHDLFFHLREGERIVEEGRFPLKEEYSFTAKGRDMVATEWLPQAATWVLFKSGGYPAVSFFYAILLAASLAVLYRLTGALLPMEARLLLTSLTAFGYMNFCAARVQSFTFLFFSLFLLGIRAWEEGSKTAPWAMAAALGLWANMHGGFMAGWFILTGMCLLRLRETRQPRELAPSLLGAFLCFLHPSGPMSFVYPAWFFFFPPASRSIILEWQPLDFSHISAAPYLLMLAAVSWVGLKDIKTPFPWAALTIALLASSLRGRKLLPLFGLAAAASLSLKLRNWNWNRNLRLGCLAGAAAVTLSMSLVARPAGSRWASRPAESWDESMPRQAVSWIETHIPGRRIFHDYAWGGYLIYKLWPRTEVFIDGRLEPYWKLLGGDYQTIIEARPGWRDALDSWDIQAVLVPPNVRIAHALVADIGWQPAYSDRKAIIFVRAPAPPRARPSRP